MATDKDIKRAPAALQYSVLIVGLLVIIFVAHSWSVGAWLNMGLGIVIGIVLTWQFVSYINKFSIKHHEKLPKE